MLSPERRQRILQKVAGGPTQLEVGSGTLTVSTARTPEELARGLSGIRALSRDTGMLFVMPQVGPASFWMRGTRVPLDIAFLDRSRRILSIQTMRPLVGTARHSGPVRYAVEARAGWFAEHGVAVGDVVKFG